MELYLVHPDGSQEQIHLGGPSVMNVYFEGTEGAAQDNDGDGRDEVEADFMSIELTGQSVLGLVRLNKRLDRPSQGLH